MKKILPYLGWALFAITLTLFIWTTKPEDTVDFRGVVKSIEYNEREKCTYFTTYMLYDEDSSVIIKAKDNISVKEITGEKMRINEIEVGDMLDLDYRGEIDGKGSIISAKWIKVCKSKDWSEVSNND